MDGACSKCGPQSCEKFHTIGEGHLSPFIVIGFLAFSMLLSYAFYTSILKNRKERPNATIQNTQSR